MLVFFIISRLNDVASDLKGHHFLNVVCCEKGKFNNNHPKFRICFQNQLFPHTIKNVETQGITTTEISFVKLNDFY